MTLKNLEIEAIINISEESLLELGAVGMNSDYMSLDIRGVRSIYSKVARRNYALIDEISIS